MISRPSNPPALCCPLLPSVLYSLFLWPITPAFLMPIAHAKLVPISGSLYLLFSSFEPSIPDDYLMAISLHIFKSSIFKEASPTTPIKLLSSDNLYHITLFYPHPSPYMYLKLSNLFFCLLSVTFNWRMRNLTCLPLYSLLRTRPGTYRYYMNIWMLVSCEVKTNGVEGRYWIIFITTYLLKHEHVIPLLKT